MISITDKFFSLINDFTDNISQLSSEFFPCPFLELLFWLLILVVTIFLFLVTFAWWIETERKKKNYKEKINIKNKYKK